ncbi:MAG: bacteriochlorophyll synthase [Phototrophicales bacterium]|nr:MAG: bacteriochlorophyll synthase [Phototrophicales bacterium]
MNINQQPTENAAFTAVRPPVLARSVALMKPITWFAPMWAFLCGAVASGAVEFAIGDILRVLLGLVMAGPILCGLSQVINDYFDREIDAINEPHRLIPAGLVTIQQVMITILLLAPIGIGIAMILGRGVLLFTGIGLLLALAYSAPPIRAKRNGWAGNTVVAIAYEGLAWLAGHIAFAPLTGPSILLAALYSLGAHGIMSINDFKSIDGDRKTGIKTIPVLYGPKGAAWLIVITMNLAQLGVIVAFAAWGQPFAALGIGAILLAQLPLQRRFLNNPMANFLKFSAIGVSIFVWGMLASAVAVRGL